MPQFDIISSNLSFLPPLFFHLSFLGVALLCSSFVSRVHAVIIVCPTRDFFLRSDSLKPIFSLFNSIVILILDGSLQNFCCFVSAYIEDQNAFGFIVAGPRGLSLAFADFWCFCAVLLPLQLPKHGF